MPFTLARPAEQLVGRFKHAILFIPEAGPGPHVADVERVRSLLGRGAL